MRSSFEMATMLVVTGITNFCLFPSIVQLYRKKLVFEAFIGMFTMVTSFLYHCCDSIDGTLWLSEEQWHRLDNIGSIMSFIVWAIYLMDLEHAFIKQYVQYAFFAFVLITQEKDPWNQVNGAVPIVAAFAMLVLSFTVRRRVPKYEIRELCKAFVVLGAAIGCFVRGLDDDNDPFRFFHGCWHAFVGIAALFSFRVLASGNKTSHLPIKHI